VITRSLGVGLSETMSGAEAGQHLGACLHSGREGGK
jgi:hypothetical protein